MVRGQVVKFGLPSTKYCHDPRVKLEDSNEAGKIGTDLDGSGGKGRLKGQNVPFRRYKAKIADKKEQLHAFIVA